MSILLENTDRILGKLSVIPMKVRIRIEELRIRHTEQNSNSLTVVNTNDKTKRSELKSSRQLPIHLICIK